MVRNVGDRLLDSQIRPPFHPIPWLADSFMYGLRLGES